MLIYVVLFSINILWNFIWNFVLIFLDIFSQICQYLEISYTFICILINYKINYNIIMVQSRSDHKNLEPLISLVF